MSLILRWNITNNCSLCCSHCYNSNTRENNSDYLTISNLEKIFSNIPSTKIRFIKLSGGEPFEFPNISYLKDMLEINNINFGISTNGMFDQTNYIKSIITSNYCKFLTFSIDGNNQRIASTLRPKIMLEKIINNIEWIKRINPDLNLAINLVINKINYSKIYEILKYFMYLNIDKVCISNLKDLPDKSMSNYICDEEELIYTYKQLDLFSSQYPKYNIELNFACNNLLDQITLRYKSLSNLKFDYRCRAGKDFGFIDNQGNLLPCEAITNDESLYNSILKSQKYSLINNSFWDIWLQKEFNNVYEYDIKFRNNLIFSKDIKCNNCRHKLSSCSSCYYNNKEAIM